MRRGRVVTLLVVLASAPSFAEDAQPAGTSVAAANGVVVHGVDTKLLAARLRDTDRKVLAGDAKGAAADLAEILAGDVTPLIEDADDAYLVAQESALQRISALPPEGLAAYRGIADPRAAALLAEAAARADPAALSRHALDMALTSYGPRMLVTLADLRAARGDARLAAQALSDLLRLWPDSGATASMPGVNRAEVVARLAAACASLGDEASVRWLARETSPALLDGPSPTTPGAKLSDDLARLAATASRAGPALPPGPTGPVAIAAEQVFAPENFGESDPSHTREIPEQPVAIGTAERPALLTREPTSATTKARVLALAPSAGTDRALVKLWDWPSKEELDAEVRRGGRGAFTPARCGDVVIFPWPSVPSARPAGGERFTSGDETASLVALSLRAEGRLVDERGVAESSRRGGDPDLERMAFCGRPLVVGDSVFTTLVRRTANGSLTELSVARFDLVADGTGRRLEERWRRHVLDGSSMPPVQYAADQSSDVEEALAEPAAMAERWGRLYLTSNTGAVVCLDGTDGRALWVQAYQRFGPPIRHTLVPTVQKTWKDVPVAVDGPYVWAAPRDAESLLEFRAMPRLARTTLVAKWRFQGGAGTATEESPLLTNVLPDELVGVRLGVGWFSGRVPGLRVAGLVPPGSPLASLRMRDASPGEPQRTYAYAQIAEAAASGSPCLVRGAILFPTTKAIYRVALDAFEAAPRTLWQPGPGTRGVAAPDQAGNLVADGDRLWSVTPRRVVLFAPK
jgi:hypothetical protein